MLSADENHVRSGTKSANRPAIILLVAGLLTTRLLFFLLPTATSPRTKAVESISDAGEYETLSRNLAEHGRFSQFLAQDRPEIFRTPGYPLLIAPLTRLGEVTIPAIFILHLLLSLGLIWAVRRLAVEIGCHRRSADLSALLVAVSPNLAFLATKVVSETLFTLVLTVCILLFNRFRTNLRWQDLGAAGMCSGLLVLIRPIATFFPLLLTVLAVAILLKKKRCQCFRASLPLLCALLVIGPWVIRNGQQTGRYVVSTAAEHNLYLYNSATVVAAAEGVTVAEARDKMRHQAETRFGPLDSTDEARFWPRLAKVAWTELRRRPALTGLIQLAGVGSCFLSPISFAPLLAHVGAPAPSEERVLQRALGQLARGRLGSALRLVWNDRLGAMGPFALTVFVLASVFLLGLLTAGLVGVFRFSGNGRIWLLAVVVYFTVLPGPVGEARFRAPIEPVLALFAASGIVALVDRRHARTD